MVLRLAMHKINLAIHEMKQVSRENLLQGDFAKKRGEVPTNLVPRANFVPLCFDNSQFISTAMKPGLSGTLVARKFERRSLNGRQNGGIFQHM